MDIYAGWLPSHGYYAFHLLAWLGGVVLLQWVGFWRLLRANRRAILWPALILGTYLVATDVVAVYYGVWHFDPDRILYGTIDNESFGFAGFLLKPFGVPIEEWAFFYLTALLVAQSYILFLPSNLRENSR